MRRVVAAVGLVACMVVLTGQAAADGTQTLTISGPDALAEGASNAVFTVSLSDGPDSATVDFTTQNGNALAGEDYTTAAGPLTIAPASSQTVTVPMLDDARHEGTESFGVKLSNAMGATLGTDIATATINDDDPIPTLVISGPASVEEVIATATYNVTMTGQSASTVRVDFATANGSASSGADFTQTSGFLEWAPGTTGVKTIGVPIRHDTLDEADESFSVNLSNPIGATIPTGTVATTITDNDNPPTATIGNATDITEGGVASFPVTLSAPSGRDVRVTYRSVNGTAVAPGDFDPKAPGSVLMIPGNVGQTTASITVQTVNDTAAEGDETFKVVLSDPNETVQIGTPSEATAKILDNEPAPSLTITGGQVTEGNAGASPTLNFTIKLSAASATAVQVTAGTGDGTATAPTDYQPKTQRFDFQPGEIEKTFSVVVKGDVLDEVNETVNVQLTDAVGATISVANAIGTISNDDNNSKLAISDASADEPSTGTATLKFTISLAPASDRPVSVTWLTANGTAAAGSDYTAGGGPVSFAPGETTKDVTVTVTGDTVNEDNETVLVNLSGASGAGISDAQGQGTIIDKNAPPSLSIDDVLTREGELVTFTITLAGNTLRTVTVVARTVDGTAKDGTEYHARRSVLTFAPGEKTKTFQVPGIDDTVSEVIETYFVDLEDPVNATVTKRRGTATIDASDRPATVTPANKPDVTKKPTGPTKILLPRMVLGPRAVTISPTGVARMVLTCSKASPIACTGVVALESTTKSKFQLGRKTFTVQRGKKAFVRIKLSVRTLQLLKRDGIVQAKAVVVVKNSAKKKLRVEPGVVTLKMSKPVVTKLLAKLLKPKPADDTKVVVDP